MQHIITTASNETGLDISELNESVTKTFAFYLLSVFEYFSADRRNLDKITDVLSQNLPEWEKIEDILEQRICLFRHLDFLQDREARYDREDRFGLYTPVIALYHFSELDKNIRAVSFSNAGNCAEDNYYNIIKIQETVIHWNSGMASVLWNIAGYKYSDKGGFMKWGNPYLQDVVRIFRERYAVFDELNRHNIPQDWIDMTDMFYLMSRQEIDMKFNIIRLQYAQLAYIMSPFVKEAYKADINLLFDILWKIFENAEVARVYIEENEYKSHKEISQIGRADRTTRLHFIFSLANQDVYSLRVDMPHKGVEYVHLNMQEIRDGTVKEAAVPVWESEQIDELRGLLGEDFKSLFYQSGEGVWWFRCHFEDMAENISGETVKKRLLEIYNERRHFHFDIQSDGYELFNDFKYYLKMFLSKLVQSAKELDIKTDIHRYRVNLWGRTAVENLLPGIDSEEVFSKKMKLIEENVLRELPQLMSGFTDEEWKKFSRRELLELLVFE